MTKRDSDLLGAHTSTSKGVANALYEGKSIDATTVQIFTSNQRRWEGREFSEKDLHDWEKAKEETGIRTVMSHASYLINLGCPNAENLHKSRRAFEKEIMRCHQLQIAYLNFHPGNALSSSPHECLDTICQSLLDVKHLVDQGSTKLALECTAGQGSTVGWNFEELGYLVHRLQSKLPIGVCLDTCHLFAAGYDIRTQKGWENVLQDFERHIGTQYLLAFHVNDSMKPLGSKRDRHAALGKGEIGLECFRFLMQHQGFKSLPKYLETPDGPQLWKQEIALLRSFVA